MTKQFLDENFLLTNKFSERLFHEYAKDLPILDYHNHLPPGEIAVDKKFANLTQVWLYGDHYKWRAMRTNGVDEKFCTGNATDEEKFNQWAATVPCTLRNPLYHWTHLELQRYFGVKKLLTPSSAKKIYNSCNELLQTPEFSVKNLLRKMKVELVCTTDDPLDCLDHHKKVKADGFEIRMLPAFRPDKAMQTNDPALFNDYTAKLESVTNCSITTYTDYLEALKKRHDFFSTMNCVVADHGLDYMPAADYTEDELKKIFTRIRTGKKLSFEESEKLKTALLVTVAEWNHEKGWIQQYHLGPLRSNNSRMLGLLGPDTGWDSTGDFPQARSLSRFLDRLDCNNRLAKTILYNINPADNEVMATMIGNFNDGSVPGKIQWGSAWWFLDQKDGMTRHLNTLSNMGLLSRFIGMLTDSRSFLSFPRHEYFRRILCNLFGEDIMNGEIPADEKLVGKMIQDICYYNAKNYFGW